MAGCGGGGVRLLMQYVGWMAVSVAAACGYEELPMLTPDGPPQFTSCMGLAMTCGASGTDSCCLAAPVDGGTFLRSFDGVNNNDRGFPATVRSFVLDKYEVTVGRFRAFVNAGLGTQASPPATNTGEHPQLAGSGWDSAWNTNLEVNAVAIASALKCHETYQMWTDDPGANEDKPMNCVTWYEAMAFCIWDGGYLPTEAEWNYAASGGGEQRAFPWTEPTSSIAIDCTHANFFVDSPPPGMFCGGNVAMGAAAQVGSKSPKGDGKWGHSDLAGNVWEWTLDWHVSPYPLPCNDCAHLTTSTDRAVRGGGFDNVASFLHAAGRSFSPPSARIVNVGWRCARTP